MRHALLSLDSVCKSFSGIPVLRAVSFSAQPGRVLGLVGENGAGKSTLMNVIGGNVQPDSGNMRLDSQAYSPRNAQEAAQAGIAFIHQELNLFNNLTVAENLFLSSFPKAGHAPLINRRKLAESASRLLGEVGLDVPTELLVERLSPGEQQLVEIAKALAIDARLILFDEPTTSLTQREIERLFGLIRQMRARGRSVLYISHNLDHVLQLCDDLVVLRDGTVAGAGRRNEFTEERLISLMVGRSVSQLFPVRSTPPSARPVLEVKELSEPEVIHNVSLILHEGEILGIAGLMGAGRSELARILFGLDSFARGGIKIRGAPIQSSPGRNIKRGLAFLTENRREEGLCLDASIASNVALATLPRYARGPFRWLNFSKLQKAIDQVSSAVRLRASGSASLVQFLSGGNQQKVVLAKWLLASPSVFLLDEPTRGIDVAARAEVYQLINEMALRGCAVLLISSELEELIGLCDRILVMCRGEITAEFQRDKFDREQILAAALQRARDQ